MAECWKWVCAEDFLIIPITYWRVNPAFPNGIEKCLSKTIDLNPKPTIIKNMNQKNLHLVTAVVATIGTFHSAKTPFSAWDVTKNIRAQVNGGTLTLKDLTGGGTFGGAPKIEIPHPTVRDIVKELFAEKLLPDYTQHDTGAFIEYRFPNATAASAPVAAPVAVKPRAIQVGDIITIKHGIVWKSHWDGAKVKNVRPSGGVDAIGAPHTPVAGMEGVIEAREIAKFEAPVVLGPKVGRFITLKAHVPFSSWNGGKIVQISHNQVRVQSPRSDWQTLSWFNLAEIASYSDAPTVAPAAKPTQAVKSSVNQLKAPDAQMWALVDTYIKNRNQRTTLKQIQSRLKGWKVTVRELGRYLQATCGLCIATPYYKSYVA